MKRTAAARQGVVAIPVKVVNYLNLLTQVLMPRAVLLAGGDAQLLGALLDGCEAQPYRYQLTVCAPAAEVKMPARRRSGRGKVQVQKMLPRGRRKLVVADARQAAELLPLFDLVLPGGLLWCYGLDARRGLKRIMQDAARARGWRMTYQPWGAGIFCAGPLGRPRRRTGGISR